MRLADQLSVPMRAAAHTRSLAAARAAWAWPAAPVLEPTPPARPHSPTAPPTARLLTSAAAGCSERLGEVISKTGLPWQNAWEVCVELDGGEAGASRAEEGINLGKPTAAALAAIGGVSGGSQVSAPPPRPRGTAPVPVNRPPPPARAPPAAKPPPPARAPPAAARPAPPARAPPPARPAPPARAPPAARPFSTQRVAPPAPAAASEPSSPLSFGQQVGTAIPAGWSEGQEFTAGGKFAPGELVIVQRSDGSLKFGEIIKTQGFFAGAYEVRCPPRPRGNILSAWVCKGW